MIVCRIIIAQEYTVQRKATSPDFMVQFVKLRLIKETAAKGINICAFDSVVVRIRHGLVENLRRRATELHPLALEAEITHSRDLGLGLLLTLIIILALAVRFAEAGAEVIHEVQRQALDLAEERTLHGDLLYLGRLAQLELLRWRSVVHIAEV